ncbi:MAG: hypothetical protein U0165_17245 [Polyangiaceae bacterium]
MSGTSSESEFDQRKSNKEQAEAAQQAEARLASAKANMANVSGTPAAASRMVQAQSGPEQPGSSA